jgi:hypothetical protein
MRRNLLGKYFVKSLLGRERIKGKIISVMGYEEMKYGKGVTLGISLESYLNAIFVIRSRLKLYIKAVQISAV